MPRAYPAGWNGHQKNLILIAIKKNVKRNPVPIKNMPGTSGFCGFVSQFAESQKTLYR
jgi:hypothetical protein